MLLVKDLDCLLVLEGEALKVRLEVLYRLVLGCQLRVYVSAYLLYLLLQLVELVAYVLVKVVSQVFDHGFVLELALPHHGDFSFNDVHRLLETIHASVDFSLHLGLESLESSVNGVFHVLDRELVGADLDI